MRRSIRATLGCRSLYPSYPASRHTRMPRRYKRHWILGLRAELLSCLCQRGTQSKVRDGEVAGVGNRLRRFDQPPYGRSFRCRILPHDLSQFLSGRDRRAFRHRSHHKLSLLGGHMQSPILRRNGESRRAVKLGRRCLGFVRHGHSLQIQPDGANPPPTSKKRRSKPRPSSLGSWRAPIELRLASIASTITA